MATPFIYGRIAEGDNFTDRKEETARLTANFRNLTNTAIISPRRWGKTSLVTKVLAELKNDKNYLVTQIDIFNCRSEEQFFSAFVNAIMRSSASKMDEMIDMAKKYLSALNPSVMLSDGSNEMKLSFNLSFKERQYTYDEILDLPQKIAHDKGKKFIVCIDEFQNVNTYDAPIELQKALRAHWQRHSDVCYCLYGSKRHMLMDIFSNYEMPFYKFGDIMFLNKIPTSEWIPFICNKFENSGKRITKEAAKHIVELTDNHSYYVQQLCQQAWLRTNTECNESIVYDAFEALVGQMSLIFANQIDTLRPKQISFLLAIANHDYNFSSREVLSRYNLGTSANIKNLRKAVSERDLIDIMPGEKEKIQDPLFEWWLKNIY